MNRLLLPILATLFGCASVMAQQGDLREKIRDAEAEIVKINKLVGATQKERSATLDNLKLVNTKIDTRQTIVKSIEREIATSTDSISRKRNGIVGLEKQLSDLKSSYSILIKISYKNYRNNSYLSFIASSRDFLDAARRLHYVKQIGSDLEKRAREIEHVRSSLTVELDDLKGRQRRLASLEGEHASEIAKLSGEQEQLRLTQASLKGREAELLAKAESRRKLVTALESELQRMVAREVSGGGGRAVSSAVTGSFEAQRGKLPMPVDGAIIDRYGEHAHPTRKGVKINNKGINIAAAAGSDVRCVFDGEVRKVFFFQGLGNSVMVRHGNYLTIYSNLATVQVKEGAAIARGATIGRVATVESGHSMLHFEIWKESDNLNPEEWVAR